MPFEREEVQSSIPNIRVYDAKEYLNLLQFPEFNPIQSTESSKRREFYKNQKVQISSSWYNERKRSNDGFRF